MSKFWTNYVWSHQNYSFPKYCNPDFIVTWYCLTSSLANAPMQEIKICKKSWPFPFWAGAGFSFPTPCFLYLPFAQMSFLHHSWTTFSPVSIFDILIVLWFSQFICKGRIKTTYFLRSAWPPKLTVSICKINCPFFPWHIWFLDSQKMTLKFLVK